MALTPLCGLPFKYEIRATSQAFTWADGTYDLQGDAISTAERYYKCAQATLTYRPTHTQYSWILSTEGAMYEATADVTNEPHGAHQASWPPGIEVSPVTDPLPEYCPRRPATACRWAVNPPNSKRILQVCAGLWERLLPQGYSGMLKALRNDYQAAKLVFATILLPNSFHFSAFIASAPGPEEGKGILEQARKRRQLDAGVFNALARRQRSVGDLEGVRETRLEMEREGIELSSHVYSSRIAVAQTIEEARQIFDEANAADMCDLSVFSAMEAALRRKGDIEGSQLLRKVIRESNFSPSAHVASADVRCANSLEEAMERFRDAERAGVATHSVYTALESAQRRFGRPKEAARTRELVNELQHQRTTFSGGSPASQSFLSGETWSGGGRNGSRNGNSSGKRDLERRRQERKQEREQQRQ
eukprot:Hpha_TRINITY_DN15506_c7_g2::TRINITY_DN15506_c7_g2_i2::g.105766::m.105766